MKPLLEFLIGVLPSIFLGLLAFVPLLVGLAVLFDQPDYGVVLILWAGAGIAGTRSLMHAWHDEYGEDSSIGLVAGIAAAAPLAWMTLQGWEYPASLFIVYWTAGPILLACYFLMRRLA